MTDREIAERIVSLPLWSELFKDEARALIYAIEAALATKGIDGARQMQRRAANIADEWADGVEVFPAMIAKHIRALPLESTE